MFVISLTCVSSDIRLSSCKRWELAPSPVNVGVYMSYPAARNNGAIKRFIFVKCKTYSAITMRNEHIYLSSIIIIATVVGGLILSAVVIIQWFILIDALNTGATINGSHTSLPSNFSFGAAGDWACNSNTISTVNNIVKKNPN